jgi:hypothetical protein
MSKARECRQIMPSGRNCQSPAVTGSAYCCHHGTRGEISSRGRAAEHEIEFDPINYPTDLLPAINQIAMALCANRITTRRAAVLLNAVQMAAANLNAYASFAVDPAQDFNSLIGFDPGPGGNIPGAN